MEQPSNLKGRVCLITGANAGIGKATAFGLAQQGAEVIMVCRNQQRGLAALEEIKNRSGQESLHLFVCDLSSQATIREFAQAFSSQFKKLHVLINNAAVIPLTRSLTEDGIEAQFAVNHLAYFLLCNLLFGTLRAGAPSRVINVSSAAHFGVTLDFDDLMSEENYDSTDVYSKTKLANVLFTYELAQRLTGTNITANCLSPGVVATDLLNDCMKIPRWQRTLHNTLGVSPERGAETPLYLAASPQVEGVNGRYFENHQAARSSAFSYNRTAARRLWKISAQLTGLQKTI